jgi:hypothetical protein
MTTSRKKIQRIVQDRGKHDMEDIMRVLLEADVADTFRFAVLATGNMSLTGFENMDILKLLQEIESL